MLILAELGPTLAAGASPGGATHFMLVSTLVFPAGVFDVRTHSGLKAVDIMKLEALSQTAVLPLAGAPGTPMTVGRDATANVVLPHPTVSKLHARVQLTAPGVVRVVDAGSRNGTFVGNERIPPGDENARDVRVGDTVTFGVVHARIVDYAELRSMHEALAAT
jgi:hypothetical protein